MAHDPVAIKRSWPVGLAMLGVAVATLGPLLAVALHAGGVGRLGPADWGALRFTLTQASLSAILSVALAVPVARALARRRFAGRGLLITLLGAPFILPVIVAVMGLLAVFGRSGIVNDLLEAMGFARISIYGLHGVVLAHVFFNLPLATRIFLQGWQSIPSERFRTAAALGFSARDTMVRLEWPMLKQVAPGALMVVFAICLSSFAVALTLGGGPRATTLELAIYQAFRFDFDLARAASLALVQLGLVGAAAVLALGVTRLDGMGAGLDRMTARWDANGPWLRVQDGLVLIAATSFLLVPMGAIAVSGVSGLSEMSASILRAAVTSLCVALAATAMTLVWAMALATGKGSLPQIVGTSAIAASPLVIGTGAFLIINPYYSPQALALPITALVNALMALPFALRVLAPEARRVEADYGRLSDALGLSGWARMRVVALPRLRQPLGFAAGLTAALSMGDLGVIALFADPDRATLPMQMYRLMGAYRMEAAAGAGLLLLVLSLSLFYLFDKGGRLHAET